MKNAIKVLAIIALSALIGFSMVACDDGSGGPGGGGGGGGGSSPNGLTVTGLPSISGTWYAHVFPAGTTISTRQDFQRNRDNFYGEDRREAFAGVRGNTFPLHLGHLGQSSVRWTGSGNRPVVLDGRGDHIATVNFSNGNATVQFSSFRELPER